ncbi:MAG: NIPSNAP family protein, partial [Achromobacter piechaudii]
WVYDSAADREAKRQALQKDPEWAGYLTKSAEAGYLIRQENRLMTPTMFFQP